ncbi:hypothetical protein BD626DRAFT_576209 [Schizophyllum amplum]|uniref:Uncharacterized protein n=1 Tax=Schizophyllum amplum TaxID=97359 RepID=A0A550BU50_9AGAR|nr:hypothetical protein BD626DRAFT_576209 [Auriculariopsis ampla]
MPKRQASPSAPVSTKRRGLSASLVRVPSRRSPSLPVDHPDQPIHPIFQEIEGALQEVSLRDGAERPQGSRSTSHDDFPLSAIYAANVPKAGPHSSSPLFTQRRRSSPSASVAAVAALREAMIEEEDMVRELRKSLHEEQERCKALEASSAQLKGDLDRALHAHGELQERTAGVVALVQSLEHQIAAIVRPLARITSNVPNSFHATAPAPKQRAGAVPPAADARAPSSHHSSAVRDDVLARPFGQPSSPPLRPRATSLPPPSSSERPGVSSANRITKSADDQAPSASSRHPGLHPTLEIGLCFAALDAQNPAVARLRKAFVEQDNKLIYLREALRREKSKKRSCSPSCAERKARLDALLDAHEQISKHAAAAANIVESMGSKLKDLAPS